MEKKLPKQLDIAIDVLARRDMLEEFKLYGCEHRMCHDCPLRFDKIKKLHPDFFIPGYHYSSVNCFLVSDNNWGGIRDKIRILLNRRKLKKWKQL